MKTKQQAGRPRIYENPEELEAKVEEYFRTEKGKTHPSVSGLALYLGFKSKSTLYEYRDREEDGFSDSIKKGLTRIEQYHEERLSSSSPGGAIFALKNMGWSDKGEHEVKTGPLSINLVPFNYDESKEDDDLDE